MPPAPASATTAVLKPSEPVPDGSRQVHGIDFNHYAARPVTADDLVAAYASMGFQASALAEAVRIINDMVSLARSHPADVSRLGLALSSPPGTQPMSSSLVHGRCVAATPPSHCGWCASACQAC